MRNWTENQVIFVFIRHGETKANEEHRYLGKTEEPLSEKGKNDLLEWKRKKYYPSVEYVFSSPMKRCLETANILYPDLCPIEIPEWKEIDFGKFEYKNYQELKKEIEYQAWLDSNGTLPFPEGESREDFILRCEKGFIKMSQKLSKMMKEARENKKINKKQIYIPKEIPRKVGIIVHGGTIMALLYKHSGGNYFDYQVLNGKGYLCYSKGLGSNARFIKLKKG